MVKSMSIPQFVRHGWQEESLIESLLDHLKRHKIKYQVIGTTVILFGVADTAFASTGIDEGAKRIYSKVINVGKWIIIIKAAIDTFKSVSEGDLTAAKKNFLGYVLVFAMLWALPWALGEVEKVFAELE